MSVLKGYIKSKDETRYPKSKQAEIALKGFVNTLKKQCSTLDDTVGYNLDEKVQATCGNVLLQYNSYQLNTAFHDNGKCDVVIRADVFVWTNKRSDNGESKWHKIMSINVARIKFFGNGIQEDTEYIAGVNDIARHLRGWF